jgi:hypothetical protein
MYDLLLKIYVLLIAKKLYASWKHRFPQHNHSSFLNNCSSFSLREAIRVFLLVLKIRMKNWKLNIIWNLNGKLKSNFFWNLSTI